MNIAASRISLLVFLLLPLLLPAQEILLQTPPPAYVCYRTHETMQIDGKLNEASWQKALWTEDFKDIAEPQGEEPHFRTRVKMLWDDEYLYIGAELQDHHLWATMTQRESVLFLENCFEIFIDPTGDTHNYYELQINALGTIWDMIMTRPYRNGGMSLSGWDIRGLQKGIHIHGTVNDPSDQDSLWAVELALPWNILRDAAPQKRKPVAGEYWRINFARINYPLIAIDGVYQKATDPKTQKPLPEHIWVWSPHYAVNMHTPEFFGYIWFSHLLAGENNEVFQPDPGFEIKYLLRALYNHQQEFRKINDRYAANLEELGQADNPTFQHLVIDFDVAHSRFLLSAFSNEYSDIWQITEDGKIWRTTLAPSSP